MKKLFNCLAKIHIQIITIFVYFIAFISGRFIPLLIYFNRKIVKKYSVFGIFYNFGGLKIKKCPYLFSVINRFPGTSDNKSNCQVIGAVSEVRIFFRRLIIVKMAFYAPFHS